MSPRYLIIAVAALMGCGVASVSPIVTDADLVYEPRLLGTWQSAKESAVITTASENSYSVLFTDEDGKSGRFAGRLGRLGATRVLDLQPEDPLPTASDTYKSLLLRAHGIVVIDSIGDAIQFRLLAADSLKAYLKKRPQAVPHTMVGDAILLTASSAQARRFLTVFVRRRGVLGERNVWRRSVP